MQKVEPEAIAEVKNVSFSYNAHSILRRVNLTIHRGDYIGLVGGNGSGKTTLIKIMLGLLIPSFGSIKLFGQNINSFKDWWRIGYVPQKATNFDPNFPVTVEEVAIMGMYGQRGMFHGITDEDRKKVKWALEQVGMWHFRNRLIGDLSGGQQQRVFIARAIATEPEIIFLDEPTVGVERSIKDEFYALLRKLNKELNLTVVLVTHDLENIAHEADYMQIACIDSNHFFHHSLEGFLKETKMSPHLEEGMNPTVHHHHEEEDPKNIPPHVHR